MKEGDIKTLDGKTVGRHKGVFYYTIGQRKGFGLGGGGNGEPYYVIDKDVYNNILYVNQGECPELYRGELIAENFNFIGRAISDGERVLARTRHRQELLPATAYLLGQKPSASCSTNPCAPSPPGSLP